MLDDKYKKYNEELSGFKSDEEEFKQQSDYYRERYKADLLSVKSEINSGKKYSKLGGRNYWFKFKLFLWKILIAIFR